MRGKLWALIVGGVVAVLAYVLVAPLGCQSEIEIVDTGPGTQISGPSEAGPVTCTRLLLPDYRGPTSPARWPAGLAAAGLGVLVGFAVSSRYDDGPPPREESS